MTEQIREQISAIMDGEMEAKSSSVTIKDNKFKDTWFRYHLISDCINERLHPSHDLTLCHKISESIQSEPTILAPESKPIPKIFKSLTGMAVAASVAAMAIFGIQQMRSPIDNPSSQSTPIAQTQTPPSNIEYRIPVQLPQPGVIRPVQVQMQTDMRINRYLLNHNEYRNNVGVGGVTPHVRLVATGSDD